jgi:hypothetical protein
MPGQDDRAGGRGSSGAETAFRGPFSAVWTGCGTTQGCRYRASAGLHARARASSTEPGHSMDMEFIFSENRRVELNCHYHKLCDDGGAAGLLVSPGGTPWRAE